MEPSRPKFIADRMLGRLTKWLRIMGLDCAARGGQEADELVEEALCEERILLTRDTRIAARKRLGPHLFIESDHLDFQIRQVLETYRLDPLAHAFQRCLRCNQALEPATLEQADSSIPDHIHHTQTRLAHCPSCQRYFWSGTHRDRMRRLLERYQISF